MSLFAKTDNSQISYIFKNHVFYYVIMFFIVLVVIF